MEFGEWIPWKWEEIPLQIKSDSVVKSEDLIYIEMGRPSYVEGIAIRFSSPIKFWMAYCNSEGFSPVYTDLPVQPPDEADKVWTFIKTASALIITCNDVELLNYEFANSEFSNCVPKWGGDTTDKILFSESFNTASDFYRAGKIPIFRINVD